MSYVDLSLAFHEAVRKFDDSGYIDQEQCVSGIKFHKMMNQYAAEILHDEVPYYPAVLPISDYQVMRTCPALRRAVAVAAYSRDFASMTNRDSNALMTMTMPG